jgi:curved DNA-binding protein CbpA
MRFDADELQKAYDLFDADENTPFKTIKQAYYALARRHHPDKNGDQEYFKVINNAFQLIQEHRRRRDNGGERNRSSEARCDTASRRDNGGKRKARDESTSRTNEGQKKKKTKASTSEEGSTEPSEEALRNIRKKAEQRAKWIAEEKLKEAARQDAHEAFLFKVPVHIKAYLERFQYGPYSLYARLPDPRLEKAYQEYCDGYREPAHIEYEDNLLRTPNRIFSYLQRVKSNSPIFPRHQPDWKLYSVYSCYIDINRQSEEQKLYEAMLLETPAKIKEYLEQENSDNPKFPSVMPNPQLQVTYDTWCAEVDARKRKVAPAVTKLQCIWRTRSKAGNELSEDTSVLNVGGLVQGRGDAANDVQPSSEPLNESEGEVMVENLNKKEQRAQQGLMNPRLPVRNSRRLSSERILLLQQKTQPKRSLSTSASQVGRLLVSSAGTWFSVSECGKRRRLDLEFVNSNFRKKFINKCLQQREKIHTVDAGAPRDVSPAMAASLSPIANPIVRYPQMGRETCVMSSFASALSHFNDPKAERIMASAISSSEMTEDRFVFLVDLLNSSNLKFRVRKYKNRVLNILDDFSCFPTVIRLAGKDGSLCHSVTTAGKWLFDSNLSHARPISLPLLDWCCSSDTVSSQFSHVAFALRLTAEKPRPEWDLCRGCRSGGLCVAGVESL